MQHPIVTSNQSDNTDSNPRGALLSGAIFLGALGAIVYFAFFSGYPVCHDIGIPFQIASAIWHGGYPYRDVIDTNPPMAGIVHIPPMLLSENTPISQPVAFQFYVTAILLISCWLTWTFLGRLGSAWTPGRRLLFLAIWLSGTISISQELNYGQREHFFAIMLLPWFFCRLLRYEGTAPTNTAAVVLGLLASPFILLKPHFLAVIFVIEFVLIVRSRKLRPLVTPEFGLLICSGITYFVYLVTLPSDARNALFFRWLPFLASHYRVYTGEFFETNNLYVFLWMTMVLALAAFTLSRRPAQHAYPVLLMIVTTFLCFGAYIAQKKGWFYHHIPPRLCVSAVLGLIICSSLNGKDKPGLRKTLLVIAGLLVCLPLLASTVGSIPFERERKEYTDAMTAKIKQYAAPGDRVDFICTNVIRSYPSQTYAGVAPGSRYQTAFMIPMVYHGVKAKPKKPFPYRTEAEQTADERLYLREKAEDIARFHPKLIAIDADPRPQACPVRFRIDDYLEFNGWRKRAMADYHYVETFRDFKLYIPN